MMRLGLSRLGAPRNMGRAAAGEFAAHGGALESCRRRGRWASLSPVQRYTTTRKIVSAGILKYPAHVDPGGLRGDCVHLSLGKGPQETSAAVQDFKPVRRRPRRCLWGPRKCS
eukprot:2672588-Pyramimonas_sp.AAC.1